MYGPTWRLTPTPFEHGQRRPVDPPTLQLGQTQSSSHSTHTALLRHPPRIRRTPNSATDRQHPSRLEEACYHVDHVLIEDVRVVANHRFRYSEDPVVRVVERAVFLCQSRQQTPRSARLIAQCLQRP